MTFELFVVWVNVALAGSSAVVLFLAARYGLAELRALSAAAAVLASIYCGAYIWLGFNFDRAREWSALLRPVSLLTWTVVWIARPMVEMRLQRRLDAVAARLKGE